MREVGGYIAGGMEGEEESTAAVLKWGGGGGSKRGANLGIKKNKQVE